MRSGSSRLLGVWLFALVRLSVCVGLVACETWLFARSSPRILQKRAAHLDHPWPGHSVVQVSPTGPRQPPQARSTACGGWRGLVAFGARRTRPVTARPVIPELPR